MKMGRMYKTAEPKGSQLVAMADDPYDFENDDYEESSAPNFEPFFTLELMKSRLHEFLEKATTRSLLVS